MTVPIKILQCYLSFYSYSIRGHKHGHFKQITVLQMACTVCVNKLDTKNIINNFHNIWRAWKQHHSRVYSDAICVTDIRLHFLLKTLCAFLNKGNTVWLYISSLITIPFINFILQVLISGVCRVPLLLWGVVNVVFMFSTPSQRQMLFFQFHLAW